ncbi:MAG TPA: metallophosphoesterase [Verrucomicrobiae bacterium]
MPPISRRQFLKGSLAASALALAGGCATRPASAEAEGWALLSDIHIAADASLIHSGVNMTHNLQTVSAEALAWPEPVSGALINGDLAYNNGESADYAAVLQLLRPLRERGVPIHLALGNHDNRERFWDVLPKEKTEDARLPHRQSAIVRTRHANWFVLDSLIQTRTTPGLLGGAQRDWLARALDRNAGKPALVAVHHNPRANNPADNGLEDTEDLLKILRPRPHVKAWFFGHTHRWEVSQDRSGLWMINFPPVAYLFQAGRPNGWVHATLQPAGARLELRCLDRTRPDHGQIVNLPWRV